MDKLLTQVENIKEKLTSQEYKCIMDNLMVVNREIKQLETKNKRGNNKLKILSNRYINLSTLFTMIASEREGYNVTNILDVCDCETDVDREYQEYLMNQ